MARKQEEAENHWPGFVDALSTIVMVVTFLLIILGVVIFIIAQQIKASAGTSDEASDEQKEYFKPLTPDMVPDKPDNAKAEQAKMVQALANAAKSKAEAAKNSAAEAKAKAEQTKAELAIEQIKLEMAQAQTEKIQATAQQAELEVTKAETELETAKAEAQSQAAKLKIEKLAAEQLDGKAKLALAAELRQDRKTEKEINGQKVLSKDVEEGKKITIASDDTPKDFKANIVQSANAILTLIFDGKSVSIDPNSAQEIQKFLTEKNIIKQMGKIEIRSYVNLNQSSMGERRRLAFYRAMGTRNELLKLEVDPNNISIKVKEVDDEKLAGILKIYIKP